MAQREMRESVLDLADDVSIIGKDIFKNTVVQLDKAGVELDTEAIAGIGLKLIRMSRISVISSKCWKASMTL